MPVTREDYSRTPKDFRCCWGAALVTRINADDVFSIQSQFFLALIKFKQNIFIIEKI